MAQPWLYLKCEDQEVFGSETYLQDYEHRGSLQRECFIPATLHPLLLRKWMILIWGLTMSILTPCARQFSPDLLYLWLFMEGSAEHLDSSLVEGSRKRRPLMHNSSSSWLHHARPSKMPSACSQGYGDHLCKQDKVKIDMYRQSFFFFFFCLLLFSLLLIIHLGNRIKKKKAEEF